MAQIRTKHGSQIEIVLDIAGQARSSPVTIPLWVVDGNLGNAHALLAAHRDGHVLLFVEIDNLANFADALRHATTFSTAVKDHAMQQAIVSQLDSMTFAVANPPVFLLENDHARITARNVSVQPVVVDRICSRADALGSDDTLVVSTEAFSEFIARIPFADEPNLWTIATSDAQFKFYVERKLFLVNTAHSALVVTGFDYLQEKGFSIDQWGVQLLPVLMDAMHATQFTDAISTFLRAQAIRLVLTTPAHVLDEIYRDFSHEQIYLDLVAYGEDVQKRMRAVPDGVARVFGMKQDASASEVLKSANKRLERHLDPFRDWIDGARTAIQAFPAIDAPRAADVDHVQKYLRKRLAALLDQAINSERKPRVVVIDPAKPDYSPAEFRTMLEEQAGIRVNFVRQALT